MAHGDIILFGAELWNLSLPNTLAKFSEMGLIAPNEADKAIGEYDRHFKRKTAVENFLYDAETQIWNHGDDVIACRLRDLGVRHEIEECHKLIGVVHYDQIAKVCAEVGRPKPHRLRDDGPAIVFPFYDLPGRLTGFLLLQYNEAYESKQTYIPVSGCRTRKPEAGYYLLKTTQLSKQQIFKNTQFVFDDVLLATKTQAESLARGNGWLPIMAGYTGPEAESYGTSWQAFSAATRIFHGHNPTPELISRACNARGYVSIVPTNRVNVFPKLSAIRTKAQTWQQTLRAAITNVNEQTAEAFSKRLTIAPDKLNAFLLKIESAFSAGFRERVMLAANAPAAAPMRVQKRAFIVERDSGWWSQSGRPIANFGVRIDEVLHADTGDKMYKGHVYVDGQTYPFIETARRIERIGLLTYASSVIAPHGKLGIFDGTWDRKAHMLAMQLHKPTLINVSTQCGWDEHANVFRFAKYAIDHNGDVRRTYAWPNQSANKDFPEPTPIAPLPLHNILTPAHENSFVWAVTAAVLSNLLAPALRKEAVATAVLPDNFELAEKIAAILGCDTEKTTAFQKHVAGNFLETKTANVSWPIACSGAFNDEVFGQNIPRYFNRPLLLRVTKQSMLVSVGYGWQAINTAAVTPPTDISALRAILPAYVQRAIQTRMARFGTQDNLHESVLVDLHTWLNETYGTSFNLPHAKSLTLYKSDAHIALMLALDDAILAGKINVLPQPRNGKQAGNYILQKKDCWWLNRRAIDRYFYGYRSVGPNWLAVIELLQKDGVYIGEEIIHNMSGILVNPTWCENFYTTQIVPQKEVC